MVMIYRNAYICILINDNLLLLDFCRKWTSLPLISITINDL